MRISVPREIKPEEARVGLTPTMVTALTAQGHEVFVEEGAGLGAGFSDDDYRVAVARFLEAAADDACADVTSSSFAAYSTWTKGEKAAGRRRPSGAAIRQHFGSWEVAKKSAEIPGGERN